MIWEPGNEAGFTLMEFLLVLAITGMLLGGTLGFVFRWQARTWCNYRLAELENDYRYALGVMAHYLRKAESLELSAGGEVGKLTFPQGEDISFGFNRTLKTLWIKRAAFPMCSYVADFSISVEELPVVCLQLTSVEELPGLENDLPIVISKTVRLRNYAAADDR